MQRGRPDTTTSEIELYIRTYFSLLRSTAPVRIRALEEAHAFSHSSLHAGARDPDPDVAAFGYAAARLPPCMPEVELVVLGQSDGTFERFGYPVADWPRVRARGRRRLLRFDGRGTLAAYVVSVSDIDDLVPILCAYQIEWNKLHGILAAERVREAIGRARSSEALLRALADAAGLGREGASRLCEALAPDPRAALARMADRPLDLRVHLLAGSFAEYQRAARLWWYDVEEALGGARGEVDRPVYFVSSNTHSLANLIGGYALAHAERLLAFAHERDPDGVATELERAGDDPIVRANLLCYALRAWIAADPRALEEVQAWDASGGVHAVENRAHVDVEAQCVRLAEIRPERLDPRVRVRGVERLAASDAVIVNIDYPLGMAAYHILAQVAQGVPRLLGVYVMGKAATLNGQVGDVLISRVVHDVHSQNTYLFRNAFSASDVTPWLRRGNVLDNQKAVTVRGPFLQNPQYMGLFYREGYTVLEMEAGPYLSALYERVDPRRHPTDEIVHLVDRIPPDLDLGVLHYASDTPYSRRQWLLSKSLGPMGTDATYACATAIVRRIFERELARLGER